MKEYLSKPVKVEREVLELLAMFFDIAYFTATSRKKTVCMKIDDQYNYGLCS